MALAAGSIRTATGGASSGGGGSITEAFNYLNGDRWNVGGVA